MQGGGAWVTSVHKTSRGKKSSCNTMWRGSIKTSVLLIRRGNGLLLPLVKSSRQYYDNTMKRHKSMTGKVLFVWSSLPTNLHTVSRCLITNWRASDNIIFCMLTSSCLHPPTQPFSSQIWRYYTLVLDELMMGQLGSSLKICQARMILCSLACSLETFIWCEPWCFIFACHLQISHGNLRATHDMIQFVAQACLQDLNETFLFFRCKWHQQVNCLALVAILFFWVPLRMRALDLCHLILLTQLWLMTRLV